MNAVLADCGFRSLDEVLAITSKIERVKSCDPEKLYSQVKRGESRYVPRTREGRGLTPAALVRLKDEILASGLKKRDISLAAGYTHSLCNGLFDGRNTTPVGAAKIREAIKSLTRND